MVPAPAAPPASRRPCPSFPGRSFRCRRAAGVAEPSSAAPSSARSAGGGRRLVRLHEDAHAAAGDRRAERHHEEGAGLDVVEEIGLLEQSRAGLPAHPGERPAQTSARLSGRPLLEGQLHSELAPGVIVLDAGIGPSCRIPSWSALRVAWSRRSGTQRLISRSPWPRCRWRSRRILVAELAVIIGSTSQ